MCACVCVCVGVNSCVAACVSVCVCVCVCSLPVCLSRVCVNWLMAGGTFSRWYSTCFCRWRRMYLGHFTKRVRSRFGWILPPTRAQEKLVSSCVLRLHKNKTAIP